MKTICLEIRDRATFIAVLATIIEPDNPEQEYLLKRSGFSNYADPYVILTTLDFMQSQVDPFKWGRNPRTLHLAHLYIRERIQAGDELKDGDVIDIEYIEGETDKPKVSERFEFPL